MPNEPQPALLEKSSRLCITFSFLVTSILALSSSMCAVGSSCELEPLSVSGQFLKQKSPKVSASQGRI